VIVQTLLALRRARDANAAARDNSGLPAQSAAPSTAGTSPSCVVSRAIPGRRVTPAGRYRSAGRRAAGRDASGKRMHQHRPLGSALPVHPPRRLAIVVPDAT